MATFLNRLFSKGGTAGAPSALPVFQAPESTRIYVIGDIHGRADLLNHLLTQIEADATAFAGRKVLISIGDVIDRGPESAKCVTLLQTALPEWEKIALRGNHEHAMLEFLARPEKGSAWLAWGGIQALESYDIKPFGAKGVRDAATLAAELEHALAEHHHKGFFTTTRLFHQEGDILFVHAGVRPGVPLVRQMADDLLFIRDDFLTRPHNLPYRVVFGHTILPAPLLQPDRVGLDTGAYQTGILTAAVLEGAGVRILQAKA